MELVVMVLWQGHGKEPLHVLFQPSEEFFSVDDQLENRISFARNSKIVSNCR